MRTLILAGAFSVFGAPLAMASEITSECQLDEARRGAQQRATNATAAAPNQAQPTVAQRPDEAQRAAPPRRRYGKRVPDAELIEPRGAL